MRSTKIICTIGPASHDEGSISALMQSGMNIVRMNMSHGTYQFHAETVRRTRKIAQQLGLHIGVLIDLQGPKIRTGKLKKETVVLNEGERIRLTTEDIVGDWDKLSVNYEKLPQEAHIGERVLLDDGSIELKVIGIGEKSITCKIVNGGIIRSYRGVNLPDTRISTPSLTAKDLSDLEFGLSEGVDYVALSFVRDAQDIENLRNRIVQKGHSTPVIAKIEKPEAIKNISRIIEVSDGVMIARGDLGAETSPQDVPVFQKLITRKCNAAGKPVITATQMLESMISHPRPTRAEASDVANAIFDGTDAVMLSAETATGSYPCEAVRVMARIAEKAETEIIKSGMSCPRIQEAVRERSVAEAVCYSAYRITEQLRPKYIVSFTLSGKTASLMSMHRPPVPIIAMSPKTEVLRMLSLFRGVHGVEIGMVENTEYLIGSAERVLIEKGLCEVDDMVLIIGGVPVLAGEPTNMLKVHHVNIERKNI
jgi:pyruvate kinase